MAKELFKNHLARVVQDGGKVKAYFPYAPTVFKKLKKYVGAKWDADSKCWISDTQDSLWVANLIERYFGSPQDKILVSRGQTTVNGAPLVRYSRDSSTMESGVQGFLIRTGGRGSRKHPRFNGWVVARLPVTQHTHIGGTHMLFNFSPERMEEIENILKEEVRKGTEDKEVFKKLEKEIKKDVGRGKGSQAQESAPEVDPDEVDSEFLRKGAVVRSTLPSKAILDRRLPEIFKNRQLGNRQIAQVSGYFRNRLGGLSSEFYDQLKERCIAVPVGTNANMYVVPPNQVPGFYQWIKEFRKKYEEYERQLREFLSSGKVPDSVRGDASFDTGYFDVVKEYLRREGLKAEIEIPDIAGRVDISFEEFHMGDQLFQMFAGEKYEELQRSLSDREKKALQELEAEVQQDREKMLHDAQKSVRKKVKETMKQIDDLAKDIEEASRKPAMSRVKRLRNALEAAESMARSTGLNARFGEAREILDAAAESDDYSELRTRLESGRKKRDTDQALADAVAGFANE